MGTVGKPACPYPYPFEAFGPIAFEDSTQLCIGSAPCGAMSSEDVGSVEGRAKLDLTSLHEAWEREQPIRQLLREKDAVLFSQNITESVKTTCYPHIKSLILPLLGQMAETTGAPLPLVEPLRGQLALLYKTFSRQEDDTQVIHDSWMLRKFLSFIKMKTRTHKPSKVPCQLRCKHPCSLHIIYKSSCSCGCSQKLYVKQVVHFAELNGVESVSIVWVNRALSIQPTSHSALVL